MTVKTVLMYCIKIAIYDLLVFAAAPCNQSTVM